MLIIIYIKEEKKKLVYICSLDVYKRQDKDIVAVVKADAYGHGAVDIVPTLLENGAKKLAVAMISEAQELIRNNITAPIIILGLSLIHIFYAIEVKYNVYG